MSSVFRTLGISTWMALVFASGCGDDGNGDGDRPDGGDGAHDSGAPDANPGVDSGRPEDSGSGGELDSSAGDGGSELATDSGSKNGGPDDAGDGKPPSPELAAFCKKLVGFYDTKVARFSCQYETELVASECRAKAACIPAGEAMLSCFQNAPGGLWSCGSGGKPWLGKDKTCDGYVAEFNKCAPAETAK
jgi:hypothetical protein